VASSWILFFSYQDDAWSNTHQTTNQIHFCVYIALICCPVSSIHRSNIYIRQSSRSLHTVISAMQGQRLRVASGATAPGPALEGAPRFRPMSLSSYILW